MAGGRPCEGRDPHYVAALAGLTDAALLEYVESVLAENGADRFAHLTATEMKERIRDHDWALFDSHLDRLWDDGADPLGQAPQHGAQPPRRRSPAESPAPD